MKKTIKNSIVAILSLCTVLTAASCGGNGGGTIINDGKTVNVKVLKAGYGTTWLYQLKEKFESLYKEQGYKINILTPDISLQANAALSEMRTGSSKTGVDLYFTQSVTLANVLDQEYGVCAAELTDMYNLPAISFDGTEEKTKIKDKLKSYNTAMVAEGDEYYGYVWANSPCGMVVNTKALANYGLDIPNTTDEMFACFDAIYQTSSSTKVYPFAWGGNNSYGYSLYSLYPNVAQVLGKEEYGKFLSLQEGDTITENDYTYGYKMYENDWLYTALEILQRQYNTVTSYPGSINDEHAKAHYNVITGKAVFTMDGDFFFNEVKTNYSKYLNDVTFARTPVNSALGDKLGIADDVMSYIIDEYDAGKTKAEIISAVQTEKSVAVTEEQVQAVIEACSCYYDRMSHIAYIVNDSPNADIAKLFLRMAASDDFGKLFNDTANASSAYATVNNVDGEYAFVNGVAKVVNNPEAWAVSNMNSTGLRKKCGAFLFYPYSTDIVLDLVSDNPSIGDVKTQIQNKTKENWSNLMAMAGYDVK